MSEINKQQTDKQFWSIVENLEGEEKDPKAKLQELAEQFRKGEALHTLDELRELNKGVGEEWHEDGFAGIYTFVDESGRLVMLGRPKDELGTSVTKGQEKTWRILSDDQTDTATIPGKFAGTSVHFRSSIGADRIYDVSSADEAEIPEGMRHWVEKFGSKLSRSHNDGRRTLEAEQGNFWTLDELAAEIDRPEREARERQAAQYEADMAEAYEVERHAQGAKQRVRKHLFMTARKHARLQEQAYRDSIRHSMQ